MTKKELSDMYLSVVIPTYNEARRIEKSLRTIRDFLKNQEYLYEVIVSDDGSSDTTVTLVEEFAKQWKELRVLSNVHRGKAPAIISGIQTAKGRFTLFTDADVSVSIDQIPKFLVWVDEHEYDVAIATREGTGAKRVNEPFLRHVMGRVFNILIQLMILPGINDTQCGFKLFRTTSARKIFEHTYLYTARDPEIVGARLGAYDAELLFVARRLGMSVREVPVEWVYGDLSKVHKMRDSYYNAKDVVKIWWNAKRGKYPVERKLSSQ